MPDAQQRSAADVRRRLEELAVAHLLRESPSEALTRELLARTRAALHGVTDGPWEVDETDPAVWSPNVIVFGNYTARDDYDSPMWEDGTKPDLQFIAEARTLVPELVAELARWLDVVAEFRRRDASADRVIARLKAENTQLNEYIGELDREIDRPLTADVQDAGRRIRSASDPVQAFDAFIEKWVSPRWHAHLADNDTNDAEYVRTVIRGAL